MRTGQSPFRCTSVKCAHAPARRRDKQSTMRRGRTWLDSPSRICKSTIGSILSHNPFDEQGRIGQARSNLPLSGCGSRVGTWMEGVKKIPRFHRRTLQFDVSSRPVPPRQSDFGPTGWHPFECYFLGSSGNTMGECTLPTIPHHCGIQDFPLLTSSSVRKVKMSSSLGFYTG